MEHNGQIQFKKLWRDALTLNHHQALLSSFYRERDRGIMEEFSFPIIATDQDLPFPHFASSPLWFFSPTQDKNPKDTAMNGVARTRLDGEIKKLDDDKMDMLWEDFNEEVITAAKCDLDMNLGFSSEFDVTKDGRIVTRKKIGMVTMLKVLKRYFKDKMSKNKKGKEDFVICQKRKN
ncbi:hypothetical protein LUZ62_041568 [Rhynchospora pubera]|uniref:Uncharacterized protein n=1 Tax=Rhynchospora pubera TaxID=906938 RepID=A0AAV8FJB8_9POAL|nr:hypothetical protein LUZ62_041568 [Rhynchospora pubera]